MRIETIQLRFRLFSVVFYTAVFIVCVAGIGACVATTYPEESSNLNYQSTDVAQLESATLDVIDEYTLEDLEDEGYDPVVFDEAPELAWDEVIPVKSVISKEDIPEDVLAEMDESAPIIDKAIVGRDGRTPIQNTRSFPYSTVVKIFIQRMKDGEFYVCTGNMVRKDAVLTAAHCLYKNGAYAYSVFVVPGAYPSNGTYATPFDLSYGKKLFVPSRYRSLENETWNKIAHDYGIIRLKKELSRAGIRAFGILDSPLNKTATLIAYHDDKGNGLVMHQSSDEVRKTFSSGQFHHYCDSKEGASGGGIVGSGSWANKILGVHASGYYDRNSYNTGALITSNNYRTLTSWATREL